jgi:hypothetical protein
VGNVLIEGVIASPGSKFVIAEMFGKKQILNIMERDAQPE